MENESTVTERTEAHTDDSVTDRTGATSDDAVTEIVDELLIEEISIDGMCGVY